MKALYILGYGIAVIALIPCVAAIHIYKGCMEIIRGAEAATNRANQMFSKAAK